MEQARAHVHIRGRVQGVNFRYHTMQNARAAGLAGWVRNLPDRRVEAVLEGAKAAVEQLVDWCRVGPSSARVDHLDVTWETPSGEEGEFRVRF